MPTLLNLQGSVLADNVDPVASGMNAGIMNHGGPPEDSPMDVFQLIFISHHPAETSVAGVLGTIPWQLVSRSQQVFCWKINRMRAGPKARTPQCRTGLQGAVTKWVGTVGIKISPERNELNASSVCLCRI